MTEQNKLTVEDIIGQVTQVAGNVLAIKQPDSIRYSLDEIPEDIDQLFGSEGICRIQSDNIRQTYTIHTTREIHSKPKKEVVVIFQPASMPFE